ncbi:MAG: bifunctional hydroxymethylpyrimidine kinase/phosphomethylpyrimidine kinase [Deltaproteobacteria bacterium]|nr:bifunctional hydroxymethylpyrimidine kinase/phosphomethylpyrimidine kinase [Deltaproteobacteria bacterium]
MKGRVLLAGGSDPSGGAGIQADIKTVTALGGYAAAAVTALTAQDTCGVRRIVELEPDFVALQLQLVLDDIGADCVKCGMLPSAGVIEAVASVLEKAEPRLPLVLDPVLRATSGEALADPEALETLAGRMVPLASVLTPNLDEAARLLGRELRDLDGMRSAARDLLGLGCSAVLLKGGHLEGDAVCDLLVWEAGEQLFSDPRIHTRSTHGTGCTLASAIACGLAQGLELVASAARARTYLREAIRRAPGYGRGRGPVDHTVSLAASRPAC